MSLVTTKRKVALPGSGLGMLGLVLTLAIIGVGGAVGGSMLLGGSGDGTGTSSPVNHAYDVAAESTLETAETAAQTVGTTSGYGSETAQSLAFDEPSVRFTSGSTSSDTTVSVANSGSSSTTSITSVTSIPDLGGSTEGSVTLATYSQALSGQGSCLYLWMTNGATWFGAQTDQSSCTAPSLPTAPVASGVSSTAIGWSNSSFPSP